MREVREDRPDNVKSVVGAGKRPTKTFLSFNSGMVIDQWRIYGGQENPPKYFDFFCFSKTFSKNCEFLGG